MYSKVIYIADNQTESNFSEFDIEDLTAIPTYEEPPVKHSTFASPEGVIAIGAFVILFLVIIVLLVKFLNNEHSESPINNKFKERPPKKVVSGTGKPIPAKKKEKSLDNSSLPKKTKPEAIPAAVDNDVNSSDDFDFNSVPVLSTPRNIEKCIKNFLENTKSS